MASLLVRIPAEMDNNSQRQQDTLCDHTYGFVSLVYWEEMAADTSVMEGATFIGLISGKNHL